MPNLENQVKQLLSSNIADVFNTSFDVLKWVKNVLGITLYSNQIAVIKAITDTSVLRLNVLGSRQSGKSFGTCVGICKLNLSYPNYKGILFAPKEAQSKRLIEETMEKVIRPSPLYSEVDKRKTSSLKLMYKNGSGLMAMSAGKTAEQEGWSANFVVVDESHAVNSLVYSSKILPLLSASFLPKLIKLGIAKYKNHFRNSCTSPLFKTIKWTWREAEIYFKSGTTIIDDVKYPTRILETMPYSIKQKLFPTHPELWTGGEMSEIDWLTQYEMQWVEDVDLFLDEDAQKKLASGIHLALDKGIEGETYVAGLDLAGGGESSGNDYTSLTIIRVVKDNQARPRKELVFIKNMVGDLYEQMQDIISIIHPQYGRFRCSKIGADYGGLGAPIVDIMKKDEAFKQRIIAVRFGARDDRTGKNFKNAMFDLAWTEIKEGRFVFPKDYDKHPFLKKSFDEWCALERHETGDSINAKILAPEGMNDDNPMSSVLGIFVCDRADKVERYKAMDKYFPTMKKVGHTQDRFNEDKKNKDQLTIDKLMDMGM